MLRKQVNRVSNNPIKKKEIEFYDRPHSDRPATVMNKECVDA